MEIGIIIRRTLTEVGKELWPHEDQKMMSTKSLSTNKATCRSDLGIGIIICRTLTKVGKELWPHEDHKDDEREG